MPNPQKENGYTPVAHEIIEVIAQTPLNATQLRIILIIWRYTYGFNRKTHSLSETFIANATGIHRKQVQRELNNLIKKKIITVETEATFSSSRILKFNKYYDSWVVANKLPGSGLVTSPGSGLVTQERKIKENIKEKEPQLEPEDRTPYQIIINLYHEICISYSKIRVISQNRKEHIRARYKQYGNDVNVFNELFTKAQESKFLKGENDKRWKADFDWLMNEANMSKVLEGKYGKNVPDGPTDGKPDWRPELIK